MRGIAVFSGTSHPELAEAICKKLGIPLGVVNINKFSNLESNVEIKESVLSSNFRFGTWMYTLFNRDVEM